uniref:Uncharacterized protein n=1 Tax=Setaria italica TaxID=4555 RepID=K4ALT1_SETIT
MRWRTSASRLTASPFCLRRKERGGQLGIQVSGRAYPRPGGSGGHPSLSLPSSRLRLPPPPPPPPPIRAALTSDQCNLAGGTAGGPPPAAEAPAAASTPTSGHRRG